MRKHVSIHELAELELNEAADFYDSKLPGLGTSFVLAIQQSVLQITRYPESTKVVRANVRRKVLRQFPYNIIYSLTPDTIRILAVASQRRRPFYWRGRV